MKQKKVVPNRFTESKTVFVYGTLLERLSNHGWLYSDRAQPPTKLVLPEQDTFEAEGFVMYPASDTFPFAYPISVDGADGTIKGELYEVSANTMAQLDILEGYQPLKEAEALTLSDADFAKEYPDGVTCAPDSLYDRKKITVAGREAIIYFMHAEQLTHFNLDTRSPVANGDWRGHMITKLNEYVESIK